MKNLIQTPNPLLLLFGTAVLFYVKKNTKTFLQTALLFLLSNAFLAAQTQQYQLSEKFDTSLILSSSHHFSDETGELSSEEILQFYTNGKFLPSNQFSPNESRIERAKTNYWQVLRFDNSSIDTLNPLLFRPECKETAVFGFDAEKTWFISHFGREIRMGELGKRNISNRFATTLKLPPGKSEFLILIRSELTKDKNLWLELYDLGYFYHNFGETLIYQYLFAGLVFGFFFFMFVYAVIQLFQTKNQSYLFYCFYLLAVQWFYLREFDLTNLLIHTMPSWASSYQVYIFSTVLIYITYLQFVRVFLETKENSPGIHQFIKTATWLLIGFLLVEPFLRVFESDWLIFTCVKYAFQISSIYVLIALMKNQTPLAKYVLYGSLCLALGAVLSMNSYFIVRGDWIEYDTLPGIIGVILENIFFIAGLSYKSKVLTKEKEKVIQELKQAEKEKALKLQLSDLKTRFLANVTHEFRTPLTVILGMADELKRTFPKDSETPVKLIKKNGEDLLNLVDQMLDITKITEGNMKLKKIQSDFALFVSLHVESFSSFVETKNLSLQFHSDEDQIIMDFDPEKIRRILNNLLSNAIKFTPEYGKILVLLQKVEIDNLPYVSLKVKDSGKGIPSEELPFIFARFYQADNQQLQSGAGSGIGLALVKDLIELMTGKISVESIPEQKTIFKILLPVENNAPFEDFQNQKINHLLVEQKVASEIDFEIESGENSAPLVLIIEDNCEVIFYLKSCLNGDFQIITASNGKAGIETAFAEIPDIIISDVMMPEADGFEVCQTLKNDERTSHIPIVLLTAKATQNDKIEGLAGGADAYLSKPFNREELLIRLEKLVESRKAMQRKYADLVGLKIEKPTEPESAFLKKANEILEENYSDENFGVTEFCAQIFYSRVQVHRKLKALTDKNTSSFIRNFRLKKAQYFLKATDLPIAKISKKCGFPSISRFNQSFKNAFNQTPSEFRK